MSEADQRACSRRWGRRGDITLRPTASRTIRETGVQGVWWNEYRDRGGELIASFLEDRTVPAILPVEVDELRRGAQRLRAGGRRARASKRGN